MSDADDDARDPGACEVEQATPPSRTTLRRWRAAWRTVVARALRRRRPRDVPRDIVRRWGRLIEPLLSLGGASAGNSARLLVDGDETMESIWRAIDDASRRIWVDMYIFEPDRVGARTLEALARAAARGCEVLLIVDAVGSARLEEEHVQALRDAGASVVRFNPLLHWPRRGPLFRRDHRKIIIIDGHTAFCGGMNLSEDYAGPRHGNGRFRDCHLELRGPCVRDLATVVDATLRLATRTRLSLPRRRQSDGDVFVQVLASSGWKSRRSIQRAMLFTVRHAVRSCLITTPYFVPPLRLRHAMIRAARAGVDVRVLTAGTCDVPIVRRAARHIYGLLLRSGVRIYEMFDCTLHAKTFLVDDLYSTVGSFNLDAWSDKRNLEVNVAMLDAAVAAELNARFMDDLSHSREVTLKEWTRRSSWTRVIDWLAYQVLRL